MEEKKINEKELRKKIIEQMIELRKKYPELWKYVNRKKFYDGGKF